MALFGNLGNVVQGALGNFQEKTKEQLTAEFGKYLFDGEEIVVGYQLIRDALIFTNIRTIFIDKQGVSGTKTAVKSIYLDSIIDVEMESAGMGLDDSEITITYMQNVNQSSNNESHASHKFEFPKKTDILPLYKMLGNIVMENRNRINK